MAERIRVLTVVLGVFAIFFVSGCGNEESRFEALIEARLAEIQADPPVHVQRLPGDDGKYIKAKYQIDSESVNISFIRYTDGGASASLEFFVRKSSSKPFSSKEDARASSNLDDSISTESASYVYEHEDNKWVVKAKSPWEFDGHNCTFEDGEWVKGAKGPFVRDPFGSFLTEIE